MRVEKLRYFKTLLYFLLVLVLFMVVADGFLVLKQRKLLLGEAASHTRQELTLIGTFMEEALLKGDYATAAQFLVRWGSENPNVAEIKATAPNGFVFAHYKRQDAALRPFSEHLPVVHHDRKLVDLDLTEDFAHLDKGILRQAAGNFAAAVVFALAFGAVLWLTFRKTALIPMEKMVEEINTAKETLEERVAERTGELRTANEELETEISERKRAEEKLAYNENYLRSIIENEPECVKIIAKDGTLVEMNPAGLAMIDADTPGQVIGKPLTKIILPEHREAFMKLHRDLLQGKGGTLIFEVEGFKGTRRWLETHAVPFRDSRNENIAALAVTRDVTEHRRLEEHLRHSQKMEALGTLTGGIAHEFNNILTAVMGYSELLEEGLDENGPMRGYAGMIRLSAERASKLTKGLLAYSRKQIMRLEPLDINGAMREVGELLRDVIAENIELRVNPSPAPLNIMADKAQVVQVLMNLAANAVDAMPSGGVLTAGSEAVEMDEGFVSAHGFGEPGAYALITVTDTGVGMDKETLGKIFEPFFTTKDVGKGTGLGLSMAYGIVKKHNGYINVYSEPGRGTSIKVYLPLTDAAPGFDAPTEARPSGGSETVLLAEDDTEVRGLIRTVLEKAGYSVIEAGDGRSALKKFHENKDNIDLLLFDVVMPHMTGPEAYGEIKKIRPDMRVMFVSGYPQGAGIEGPGGGFTVVSKPIKQNELLSKIREIIEGAPPQA